MWYNGEMTKHRSKEPTHNPSVDKYVFTETNEQYQRWIEDYMALFVKAQSGDALKATMTPEQKRNFSGTLSLEEKEAMRRIREKIIDYKSSQLKKEQSVLSHSVSQQFIGAGKDNTVYKSNKGEYVTKYSARKESGNPETVEYLRKKYQILKKYMGDYIPDSKFIFGEIRTPMVKNKIDQRILNNGDVREVAITIQRKVQGRDFSQMSEKEKQDPRLIASLKKGFGLYWQMKDALLAVTQDLGKDSRVMDVTLELGALSAEPNSDEFDQEKAIHFNSPNVMWDEEKQQIYFIDFDMNTWNPDKEAVYQAMMKN